MLSKNIRHFEILDKIGEGGMGAVYRARDTQLQRTVAIKFLSDLASADAEKQRRFVQEAQSASALNHPNIITVYDAASENRTYFIVMEYVQGKPLNELIPRQGMKFHDVLKIGIQVADALSCAHDARIIHRDIKPSNIMLREDGLVKVLDFGLAKPVKDQGAASVESTRSVALTQEGMVLGTLNYMSPEQLESGKVDARSDIFSFGTVLFEMLTGQRAFQREYRLSSMSAILRDEPKWPERIAGPPAELERIIKRCLRKDPERRYQSIKDVRNSLEEIREDSQAGRLGVTLLSIVRQSRLSVTLAAITTIVMLSGLAAWRIVQREPEQLRLTLRPLTDYEGTTRFPAISPDGKLVAYSSNRAGDAGLDIWVQQLAPGARPIRLTSDPADELTPSFSPDGSQIAFSSIKDGGSLYVMPALGGEQRLVARSGVFSSPRFSPDGKWLAVAPNAFVIPASGGSPRHLVEGSTLLWSPVWSPDGKHVLFAGDVRESEPDWSVVPAEGGNPVRLGFQKLGSALSGPREWIDNSIVFSDGDIKRVRVRSSPWRVDGPVESLTSSPGVEMEPRAILHPTRPGRLMIVFTNGVQQSSLWEVPIDQNQGTPAPGGARRLSGDHSDCHTPSLSANGKRLAYVRAGLEGFEIHARELDTGLDRILTRVESRPRVRIAPDGSSVAINPRGVLEDKRSSSLCPGPAARCDRYAIHARG